MNENNGVVSETDSLPEGMQSLVNGYIAYAEEVIKDRALPDARDGLKPVNRRIIYRISQNKTNVFRKCAKLAGDTLELHPHGDESVYQAMVRMTSNNGTLNMPTIEGNGSFGSVYSTDKPANKRYTEAKLHDNAYDYLGELDGVSFSPNFDATTSEPDLLPVSYPALLCNSVNGIAVGFSCNIPAFNLEDVVSLVKEYINDGECKSVIYPDFTTGGYYIKNSKELAKLMQVGKAKLKLRGRVEVVEKEINIREVPFGKTLQGIRDQIKTKNIAGVKDVSDYDDFEHGACLCVMCTSKNRVDEVLLELYRETSLQDTFNANMTAVIDGQPQTHGVWDYIKIWTEWRKEVLSKNLKIRLDSLKESAKYADAFVQVVSDPDKRDTIVDLIVHKNDGTAVNYIRKEFGFNTDIAKWITQRRASQFRDGGKYRTQYEKAQAEIKECEGYLNDLGSLIIKQLDELLVKRRQFCKRKTEITDTDYEFLARDKEVEIAKDMTECTYIFNNGFLKKLRYADENADGIKINALASDVLIGLDNRGRVLRIYCENLPYHSVNEIGLYLPKYFGVDASDKSYEIKWVGKLDGTKKMLIYNDGTVGFLDTSEWVGLTRQVKVVERGIFKDSSTLCHVTDLHDYIFAMDGKGRIAYESVVNIKQKARTARTRVFTMPKDSKITAVAFADGTDGLKVLKNMSRYNTGKLVYLENADDYIAEENIFKRV